MLLTAELYTQYYGVAEGARRAWCPLPPPQKKIGLLDWTTLH